MTEDGLRVQYEPIAYPDQSVDLNDQYRQFVADVTHLFDDDVCGDLLGFEDGTIKVLPAGRDHHHHRYASEGPATTEENFPLPRDMARSLLMSNAPGNCDAPAFDINDGWGIQDMCGLSVPACPVPRFTCSPQEISPYEFCSSIHGAELDTPALSPPSSVSSDASALPWTPPVDLTRWLRIFDATTYVPPCTPHLAEHPLPHLQIFTDLYEEMMASSMDPANLFFEPSDEFEGFRKICWDDPGSPSAWLPVADGEKSHAPTPTPTTIPLPQIVQPERIDPCIPPQTATSSCSHSASRPARTEPPRTPTPPAELPGSGGTKPDKSSEDLTFEPPSSKYYPESDSKVTNIANSNSPRSVQNKNKNAQTFILSTPKPPTAPAPPSSSPQKRCREVRKPVFDDCYSDGDDGNSNDDDEYRAPSSGPVRNAPTRKKRRKATATRGAHHRFFCSWPGCKAGFTRFYDQTRHEAKHSGGGKEVCRVCGEALSRRDSLNRHMASQHPGATLGEVGSDQELSE